MSEGLVIGQEDRYTWPVRLEKPIDGGKYKTVEITVTFRRLPQERIDDLVASAGTRKMTGDGPDDTLVKEVVIDWDNRVLDVNRAPIPFSSANLDMVLKAEAGLRTAIATAYLESVAGGRRKN